MREFRHLIQVFWSIEAYKLQNNDGNFYVEFLSLNELKLL